jgi:oxygen-independent coproporphyrinogen-3 oxidase
VEELPPLEDYFKLVLKELEQLKLNKSQSVKSLYFGGGTPSLASKRDLNAVVEKVKSYFIEKPEITLEINPGTLKIQDFKDLKIIGFNRFSLGVQTFNPRLLKSCGRQHSPADSLQDLDTLSHLDLNYNMDLLYGLPGQTLDDLLKDLEVIKEIQPPHVSAYNLTLAKGHRFQVNRPSDDIQIEMMDTIESELKKFNCLRYEVSNFSQPGFEAVNNKNYWEDVSYFGFGIGAHSYDRDFGEWGRRYWNTAHYKKYEI